VDAAPLIPVVSLETIGDGLSDEKVVEARG
jgi:hypothetical protein